MDTDCKLCQNPKCNRPLQGTDLGQVLDVCSTCKTSLETTGTQSFEIQAGSGSNSACNTSTQPSQFGPIAGSVFARQSQITISDSPPAVDFAYCSNSSCCKKIHLNDIEQFPDVCSVCKAPMVARAQNLASGTKHDIGLECVDVQQMESYQIAGSLSDSESQPHTVDGVKCTNPGCGETIHPDSIGQFPLSCPTCYTSVVLQAPHQRPEAVRDSHVERDEDVQQMESDQIIGLLSDSESRPHTVDGVKCTNLDCGEMIHPSSIGQFPISCPTCYSSVSIPAQYQQPKGVGNSHVECDNDTQQTESNQVAGSRLDTSSMHYVVSGKKCANSKCDVQLTHDDMGQFPEFCSACETHVVLHQQLPDSEVITGVTAKQSEGTQYTKSEQLSGVVTLTNIDHTSDLKYGIPKRGEITPQTDLGQLVENRKTSVTAESKPFATTESKPFALQAFETGDDIKTQLSIGTDQKESGQFPSSLSADGTYSDSSKSEAAMVYPDRQTFREEKCVNAECGKMIPTDEKGNLPPFCSHCGTTTVHIGEQWTVTETNCVNAKCAKNIRRDDEGNFPLFCSYCGTAVVDPEQRTVTEVNCVSKRCDKKIRRDEEGNFPLFCSYCGTAVVDPDQRIVTEVNCVNERCGQKIRRDGEGNFPLFCSYCGTAVVDPDRQWAVTEINCVNERCGKKIRRDEKGNFPLFCSYCGTATVDPDQRQRVTEINCVNERCGKKTRRDEEGNFPSFCSYCGTAVVDPDLQRTVSEMNCVNERCGRKIRRDEEGSFPPFCSYCRTAVVDPDVQFVNSATIIHHPTRRKTTSSKAGAQTNEPGMASGYVIAKMVPDRMERAVGVLSEDVLRMNRRRRGSDDSSKHPLPMIASNYERRGQHSYPDYPRKRSSPNVSPRDELGTSPTDSGSSDESEYKTDPEGPSDSDSAEYGSACSNHSWVPDDMRNESSFMRGGQRSDHPDSMVHAWHTSATPDPLYTDVVPGAQYARVVPGAEYASVVPGAQYTSVVPGAQYTSVVPGAQYTSVVPGAQYTSVVPDAQYTGVVPGAQYTSTHSEDMLHQIYSGASSDQISDQGHDGVIPFAQHTLTADGDTGNNEEELGGPQSNVWSGVYSSTHSYGQPPSMSTITARANNERLDDVPGYDAPPVVDGILPGQHLNEGSDTLHYSPGPVVLGTGNVDASDEELPDETIDSVTKEPEISEELKTEINQCSERLDFTKSLFKDCMLALEQSNTIVTKPPSEYAKQLANNLTKDQQESISTKFCEAEKLWNTCIEQERHYHLKYLQLLNETEKSLRNFVEDDIQKLAVLVAGLHIPLPWLTLLDNTSDESRRNDDGAELTFKAVLAHEVLDRFEDVSEPTVEIRSSLDNFKDCLVPLEKDDNDIWTGCWKPPFADLIYMEYRYYIHSGQGGGDDCYEWLGKGEQDTDRNRHIMLRGVEETVYDGIVLSKPQHIRKRRPFSSALPRRQTYTKEQEYSRGLVAMLPSWVKEVVSGTPIQSLHRWIGNVRQRQSLVFAQFNHDNSKAAKEVDEIYCKEYMYISLNAHSSSLTSSFDMWQALTSLAGLLTVSTFTSWHDSLSESIPNSMRSTMKFVGSHPSLPELNTESITSQLKCEQEFLRKVADSVVDVANDVSAQDGASGKWIPIIPLVHLLRAPNEDKDRYGEECLSVCMESHEQSPHQPTDWKKWLESLQPFFMINPVLPYTFMILLSEEQLSDMLQFKNELVLSRFPLDGTLTLVRDYPQSDKIIDGLMKFMTRRKSNVYSADTECLELAADILRHTWTGRCDLSSVQRYCKVVQIYLNLMGELMSADAPITFQDYGSPLVDFVGKFKAFFLQNSNMDRQELKFWQFICACKSEHPDVQISWSRLCRFGCQDRLERVAGDDEMFVINLFCDEDISGWQAIDVAVEHVALPYAKGLLERGQATLLEGRNAKKIGLLVNEALNGAWAAVGDSPTEIVQKMTNWENFLPVWKSYRRVTEKILERTISEVNEERLNSAVSTLKKVVEDMLQRNITFGLFNELNSKREQVLELCEVCMKWDEDQLQQAKEVFESLTLDKAIFTEFHQKFCDFWPYCDRKVTMRRTIAAWKDIKLDQRMFSETIVNRKVVCEHIPVDEFSDILAEFEDIKHRRIFFQYFLKHIKMMPPHSSLLDVASEYSLAVTEYKEIVKELREGSMSIDQLHRLMAANFNNDVNIFCRDLEEMLEAEVYVTRMAQIKICTKLSQYHKGADVMLRFRQQFDLTGDFPEMERIIQTTDSTLLLKQIDKNLLAGAEHIKDLTYSQTECLQEFLQHTELVDWARSEVPKQDINRFVELASTNQGRDTIDDAMIQDLLNALTGYSPLIYDPQLQSKDIGYNEFVELCMLVLESLARNPQLTENLRRSALALGRLKDLNSHFGDVEVEAMDQAVAINRYGVYQVGNIQRSSTELKSIEDVMLLKYTIHKEGEDDDGKEMTYSQLTELQSKLALVAGDEKNKNRDTIQLFGNMKDAVHRLAQAYMDIRKEGCIQFNDMSIFVHCYTKDTTLYTQRNTNITEPSTSITETDTSIAEPNTSITEPTTGSLEPQTGIEVHLGICGNWIDADGDGLEQCQKFYNYLTECVRKQRGHMDLKRRQFPELNFYTTEQLMVLRKEMGEYYGFRLSPRCLKQSLPLLAMISPVSPAKLHRYITDHFKDISRDDLTSCSDLLAELLSGPCDNKTLEDLQQNLWDDFNNKTADSIKDLLGIAHLGYVLTRVQEQVPTPSRPRRLPDWLGRGKPSLLAVPARKVYQMVLTIYQYDESFTVPTRNEVLICSSKTRKEEATLFFNRALADSNSYYCMVNCHLLNNEVCRQIEPVVSGIADEESKDYGLAFIYAEETKSARIRLYLEKYLVKIPQFTELSRLSSYVQQMLKVPESVQLTACSADPHRSLARLVRSSRAGVGKSLFTRNLRDAVRADQRLKEKGEDITIPVYKIINTDEIIKRLTGKLENGYTNRPHHTVHMDIAHEVESGVDELLFNLIILRSIVNSEGVVWQAQPTQYYIIESMPFTKDGKSAHEVLDMLPTTMCSSPLEVLGQYMRHDKSPDDFIGFDPKVLEEQQWQIVLKFLDCHRKREYSFKIRDEPFVDRSLALQLVISNCSLNNPSWSELRHYVYFLSSQLSKVDNCPSCSDEYDEFVGFRKIVVQFMLRMAQDFATRSLKIAEESPGLSLDEVGSDNNADLINQLGMRTSWESKNHPYLFFNEDGSSFTPLGFYAAAERPTLNYSLVDCKTKQVLDGDMFKECISRKLKRALDEHNFPMSEDFDNLRKTNQLKKLRSVMVATMKLSRTVTKPVSTKAGDATAGDAKAGDANAGGATAGDTKAAKKKVVEEDLFRNFDPDPSYVLTMDNAQKILAIHLRLRENIPVVVMGETGCGKTKLIEYMSKLQVPYNLKERIEPMKIVKIHGGTTEEHIIEMVKEAEKLAKVNQDLCTQYAEKYSEELKVYTILFLDEANTTEAIGLVKEILCDGRMRGEPLDAECGLKIVAACNPYKRHEPGMIEKLKKAGLGYHVGESDTRDKLGEIPMRHLVYRVQRLPQSLLPLVWDFGTLKSKAPVNIGGVLQEGDLESAYIKQMVVNFNVSCKKDRGPNFSHQTSLLADILSATQNFMRDEKDECSFVSLRDIQRTLDVTKWFFQQREYLYPAIDELKGKPAVSGHKQLQKDHTNRSLLLALGVCYLARLEEHTRLAYAKALNEKLEKWIGASRGNLPGAEYLLEQIELCQDFYITHVVNDKQHKNIAKNKALKENVFMMIVCIENRIPLFLVGKPGSSKSLSKAMVFDAMQGNRSTKSLFRQMKQTYMVSFQCSKMSTADGIVDVFDHCANIQKGQNLDTFVSVVVLDEVGLAEDSESMPLTSFHPLLEDGCEGNKKPEPYMKCAFVGISNWALDPAKMNRGIFVQRGTPEPVELTHIAREICQSPNSTEYNDMQWLIDPLTHGYLEICKKQKPDKRKLTEFFGLRDFYSLMKMVVNFARKDGPLNRNQLEHSIRRNFGGFNPEDTEDFDPMAVFRSHIPMGQLPAADDDRPRIDPIGLIQSSLSGEDTALRGMESRYLLILTENLSVLSIILDEFASHDQHPEVVFGSRFPEDISYTQVCLNIYRIKTCMGIGKTVILLNLDDLYESLYDALNQYFSVWGDKKFVDLGLGTDRVKAFVHDNFRLVVIADKNKVHSQFPIPLINRLEKHYVSATSLLPDSLRPVKKKLEQWATSFVTPAPTHHFGNICPFKCDGCASDLSKPYKLPCLQHYIGPCCTAKVTDNGKCPRCDTAVGAGMQWVVDTSALENRQFFENCSKETAFIGYSTETTALAVQKAIREMKGDVTPDSKELLDKAKFHLLQCATGEAVLRLDKTELSKEAKAIQEIYLQHQHHETLLQYLSNELLACVQSMYIQVTSFADLMNVNNVKSFERDINQFCGPTEVFHVDLKYFVREDQFTDAIKRFYHKQSSKSSKLLLVQCEAANENVDLLDSVRYIIMREGKLSKTITHTVLLLNLPRGHHFTGYQGGQWQCVHIDDRKSANIQLPSLKVCLDHTPSEIVKLLIVNIKLASSAEEDGPPPLESDDEPPPLEGDEEETEEYPDREYVPESQQCSITSRDGWISDGKNMLSFIGECLPAALSVITTDEQYDERFARYIEKTSWYPHESRDSRRRRRIKELISPGDGDKDFLVTFLEHVCSLLAEQEKNARDTHWVTSDAVKACNMKQSETMRHSLEDSLERALVPALAAVISFIDVRENLQLVRFDSPFNDLWMQIFSQCDKLGLRFDKLSARNKPSGSHASSSYTSSTEVNLPESYKIRKAGHGGKSAHFPFSWLVKEEIDKLALAAESSKLDCGDGDALLDQFKLTAIGKIVMAYGDGGVSEEMLNAYITDFVYMAHPCSSETEHSIVAFSIKRYLQDRGLIPYSIDEDSQNGNQANMVDVYLAYKHLRTVIENLSTVIALFEKDYDLASVFQQLEKASADEQQRRLTCDVLALNHLVQSLAAITWQDISAAPKLWIEKVDRCKLAASSILNSNEINKEENEAPLTKCRDSWLALVLKKLYIEHILISSPGDPASHAEPAFIQGKSSEEFKLSAFEQVLKHVNGTMNDALHSLYIRCPGCAKVLKKIGGYPQCDCRRDLLKNFQSDLSTPAMDASCLDEFKKLRKRLMVFFMSFISDIVFDCGHNTTSNITAWLQQHILPHSTNTELEFLLFHHSLDLDLSYLNILRPFILKLLLKCKQGIVEEYLNKTLSLPASSETNPLQTMLLLVNCYMDMYITEIPQNPARLCESLDARVAPVTNPVQGVTIQNVRDLAFVQCLTSHIVEALFSLHSNNVDPQLEMALKDFIKKCDETRNSQPRYMIARQLLATHGESFIKDVANSSLDALIPDDVKLSLQSFTVPVVLSYEECVCYKEAKKELISSLAPEAPASFVEFFTREYQAKVSVVALVAFTAITCRPDVAGGQQFLKDFCKQLEKLKEQYGTVSTLLEILWILGGREDPPLNKKPPLPNRTLPKAMDVRDQGNHCYKMSFGLLVVNMYCCLSEGAKPHLGSLYEIFHQPSEETSKRWELLPTMSDSPQELLKEAIERRQISHGAPIGLKYSRCVKGHITFHKDGLNKMECDESKCGAYICHTDTCTSEQATTTAAKSKKGHILGSHKTRSGAQPVRELNSLSCAVLRCITHLCMYTASLFHRPQIRDMILPFLWEDTEVQPFLESHLQLDIHSISECCARSEDDCVLLIHDVINRMKRPLPETESAKLSKLKDITSSVQRRRQWEQQFDKLYIKPTFDDQVAQLQQLKHAAALAVGETDVKNLLSTADNPINDENILASPTLWVYRRPLTMSALRSRLHSTEQACPHLQRVVDNSEMLIAIQWLPDILSLAQILNDRFHSKLSRVEAAKVSIGEICHQHAEDIPRLEELVEHFLSAWNIVVRHNADVSAEFAELNNKSAISKFLIDQQRSRSPAYVLVKILAGIHNAMLTSDTVSSPIQLSAVTQLNVVCMRGEDEILSLVASHSEYELKETTTITYNWSAIDSEVLHRYISNKPKINFSNEQLPHIVFKGDFDLHNQMQAIDASQELLSADLEHHLFSGLDSSVQILTSYLKELKVVINFLSVMSHIERDNSLAEYMDTTFGREPEYLSKDIQLKHVKHVWLTVKYAQTDLLMHQQEPFDDVDGECREALTAKLKGQLNICCMFNSQKTRSLLHRLFTYIIFRLNKEAILQANHSKDLYDTSLREALETFVPFKSMDQDQEGLHQALQELPDNLKVKHAAKAWCYMWRRYTTQDEYKNYTPSD